ncbi:MAG: cytochrome c oxidase subunit I [Myxococcales bacterium]|nr:cytochrome c oxidase subunit I [Myxococcales bacterium]
MSSDGTLNYLNVTHGLKSWLLTLDHKRIGILYLIGVSMFFAVGGLFALLLRVELLTPEPWFIESDTYNKFFTLHGVVMTFFFLIPSIPAIFGNFLVPIMIGAKDMAFPKLNLFSWYVYMVGGFLGVGAIALGGVDTGWTFYTPYSSGYASSQVILAASAAFVAGFSSILTGLNFIVTIHKMRAPGMTWFRMPLFVWGHYATALIMILGTPVIAVTLLLLMLERGLGIGIFDPKLGGDPILFQHLFWFYSHPAVYIMLLPGMGVISEIISCFSRKPIFGYNFIAFSSLAIAILGFLVWGHHMFTSGQSVYTGVVFSLLTMAVAVPSAIKVFNWTATMFKGSVSFSAPMLYALGFIALFLVGGLTGVFLATLGLDIHVHDTYFVVAHFHFVMVGATVSAYLGALHFWWPKMTGRMYPQTPARVSALLTLFGFVLAFLPQFVLGYLGMPRRYHTYPDEFQLLHVFSTAGASVLGVGFLIPAIYLVWSLFFGKLAPANPWFAKGLEWDIQSPPTTFNFEETPIVKEEPYAYDGPLPDNSEEVLKAGENYGV